MIIECNSILLSTGRSDRQMPFSTLWRDRICIQVDSKISHEKWLIPWLVELLTFHGPDHVPIFIHYSVCSNQRYIWEDLLYETGFACVCVRGAHQVAGAFVWPPETDQKRQFNCKTVATKSICYLTVLMGTCLRASWVFAFSTMATC